MFNETHNVTTTAQGLINLNIGSINDLSIIDWGTDDYFVKITVNDTEMGTSQLLSVPYALYANNSGEWTTNANTLHRIVETDTIMTVKTNGKVGIGTASPLARLHIKNSTWTNLAIEATTNDPTLQLTSDGTSSTSDWVMRKDVSDSDKFQWRYNNIAKVTIDSVGNVGIGTKNPDYKLEVAGNVNITGSYLVNGSDFAEYFINEEELIPGDIAGINLETGKVRKYQVGDELVGIVSDDAGYVGNNALDRENDFDYTLVGLSGQLEFDESQVIIENRVVKTIDGIKIGVLLANGKVFIR